MPALRGNRPQKRTGFALIVALFMMALVLALVLSMSLLVQVEIENSSSNLDLLHAKESAMLALYIGIGELQKHAGADQRVTARAEIINNHSLPEETSKWTGVWDTTKPSQSPIWLVSGNGPTPQARTKGQLTLYRSPQSTNSEENIVQVPKHIILSKNGHEIHYGWWVSDEGSKVHVGLPERLKPLDKGFFDEFSATGLPAHEQNQILSQSTARRFNSELFYGFDTSFVPKGTEDITSPVIYKKILLANNRLRKLQVSMDLRIIDGVDIVESTDAFHHATSFSKSVIVDTANGGLKIDLSDRFYSNTSGEFKVNKNTKNFLWGNNPDLNAQIQFKGMSKRDIINSAADEPINTTPVLMTEGTLYFAISGEDPAISTNTARAFLRFEGEMWSPYGFRHQFIGSAGSNTPEIMIEFEKLPDISIQFFDKDTGAYTSDTVFSFDEISPHFEIDFTNTHKAGEIRKIAGNWPINTSAKKSDFHYTKEWEWTVNDPSYNKSHRLISYPDGDSISYQANPSKVTILIKNMDGDLLQEIKNIPVGAINTAFAFYEDSPKNLLKSSAPIAFQFRMRDDLLDLEDWFTMKDPRAITLDLSDPTLLNLYDINDIDSDDKMDADFPKFNAFSNLDFFHGVWNNKFFRLFDIPAAPPVSVGIFQHLQFKGSAPFSVGNSWGKGLNEVFDRFFISGIPRDPTQGFWSIDQASFPGSLPNPFLTVRNQGSLSVADLINKNSAQHLYSDGAFNFNSTSQKAWQAVLSSNTIYNWTWFKNRGTSTEKKAVQLNLESTFFRLPNSGHMRSESFTKWRFPFEVFENKLSETDDYPYLTTMERALIFQNAITEKSIKTWGPAVSLGHREIDADSIKDLANEIVRNLKKRGRPFISFKELINSGLLQKSIDATSINSIDPSTRYTDASAEKRLPRNSTAYLSQADIFSTLSPAMSPRSDTFRVRAYASIYSTLRENHSTQAYCEAIVQRTPDRVDGDESRIMENADGLGRRFKVINIRWIDTSQLY